MSVLDELRRRRETAGLRDDEERLARAAWTAVVEPGDGVAGALVGVHGAVDALRLVEAPGPQGAPGADGPGAKALASALERWRPRLDADRIAAALAGGGRAGLALVAPGDAGWPAQLDDLGPHAPLALWTRGDASSLSRLRRSVAIVGARAATAYGEHVAADLAGELAARGIGVVSGAAYGIDAAAHRAALGAGGETVALVAGGADRVYPAGHARLFGEIAARGAVASETAPGTMPTKWRFLMRNRLISALAGAVVVVEAGTRSGTLNTAGHAAALGRPLGAVPGPVTSTTSAGCHRLLREFDAQCITTAVDVLEMLGEAGPAAAAVERTSAEETRVRDALAPRIARDLDEIVRRSGMAPADVQAALGLLELTGSIRRAPDGWLLA